MIQRKPPLGVIPEYLSAAETPEPTVEQLLARYVAVATAVQRYREAGLAPRHEWLRELGIMAIGN